MTPSQRKGSRPNKATGHTPNMNGNIAADASPREKKRDGGGGPQNVAVDRNGNVFISTWTGPPAEAGRRGISWT